MSEKKYRIAGYAYQLGAEDIVKLTKESPLSFPMYSFERISRLVIKGIAERLEERGFNEEQIKEGLRSKTMRHILDNDDMLEKVGRELANQFPNI